MGEIFIGCGQVHWSGDTPEEQILADIARAGYLGAPGYQKDGRSAAETLKTFARFGLKPAPGYFSGEFWKAEKRADLVAQARQQANFMHQLGCSELYIGPGGFEGYVGRRGKHRKAVAGHVQPEDGMTDAEFQTFAGILTEVCEAMLAEGVRGCLHNHVGSVIETGEEIDRLLAMTDPEVVFLGPDTGHLIWGGVDPVDFFRRHASRIKTVHLKDAREELIRRCVAEEWDYAGFCDHGGFVELGGGEVNFPALFDILRGAGFSGWVIVETDVITTPTPYESILISREYLRRIGVG